MSHPTAVGRHSSIADFELIVAGRSYAVAQVAPEFILLDTPADIPPGPATLIIRSEGHERRRDIELPEGGIPTTRHVKILRGA